MTTARRFPALMVLLAMSLGALVAIADASPTLPTTIVATPPSTSISSAPSSSLSTSSSASITYVAPTFTTGLAPMPSGSATPVAWMPPGADASDPGPSLTVFPAQKLTIRFDHAMHADRLGLECVGCHVAAKTSTQASDELVPTTHAQCLSCHSIDEKEPLKVDQPVARCDACHLGGAIESGTFKPSPIGLPSPNLKMNHKAHADRGVACAECHGQVDKLQLATRDQLPRMKGCLTCHTASDTGVAIGPKSKGAKAACATCHVTDRAMLKVSFPTGMMLPPAWLKDARHGADWIERHKRVAGTDSQFCSNCHKEEECTDCHDGRTRPRDVHPNDWLSMHAVAARFDQPKCSSCHSTSSFCVTCHTRAGVAQSSPTTTLTGARFHPPASVWSSQTRGPGHHSFEAQKNINACVSCHVERDCVVCHGTAGVGGAGSTPHDAKFRDRCAAAFTRNPRPCFVCHSPGDAALAECR